MKTETHVVLISVDFIQSRKTCERIENTTFKDKKELIKKLEEELIVENVEEKVDIVILKMTDFMDAVNNQELDNLSEFFISYVQIQTK